MTEERRGWFAEVDAEAMTEYRWRPVLQANGWLGELGDIWFRTEGDCLDWIKSEILGHGLLDGPRA